MELLLLLIVLIFLLGGGAWWGGYGYRRRYPEGNASWGWSPLLILVVIIVVLWLAGIVHAEIAAAAPLLAVGGMATPTGAFISSENDPGPGVAGYVWKYVVNVAIFIAALITAVGNYLTLNPQVNAAWLGLTDVQWHIALLIIGVVGILYNGLTHAPPVTAPPTKTRLNIERRVHAIRNAAH